MNNELIVKKEEVKLPSVQDARAEMLDSASWMAKKIKTIIDEGGLSRNLGGKKPYVDLEAWTTVARLHNETPHAKLTKVYQDANGREIVEAHAWVESADGEIVSEADAIVSTSEGNWKSKPLYQRVSMAQTRALGKALRLRHSWIIVMAGYSATPSEELVDPPEPKQEGAPKEEPTLIIDAPAAVKPAQEESKKPQDVTEWKGHIKEVIPQKLPGGRRCWTLVAENGLEFKTLDESHAKVNGGVYLIRYKKNGKGSLVIEGVTEVAA